MKNLQINKRAIAFLGAVTITLTMGSCGVSNQKKQNSKGTSVTIISSVTEPSLSTDISSVTTTVTTQVTTEPTFESTTSITEPTTISTTNPTTISTTKPTTVSTTKPTTVSTTKPTTISTSKSKPTTKYTTKSTTTKTTTKSTTTTSSTTKPKATTSSDFGTKYALTYDTINNVEAIDKIAKNPNYNLFAFDNGALLTFLSYIDNGQQYDCGVNEYRTFIALLNYEYIEDETIIQMFGGESEENTKRYAKIIMHMTHFVCKEDMVLKYDNFIISEQKRKFLNELQNLIAEYKITGDYSKINPFLSSYYDGNNPYIQYGDNDIIDGYISFFCYRMKDWYDNEYIKTLVSSSLDSNYYKMMNYSNDVFFAKARGKQLTK